MQLLGFEKGGRFAEATIKRFRDEIKAFEQAAEPSAAHEAVKLLEMRTLKDLKAAEPFMKKCVDLTKNEEGCMYYGWAIKDDKLFCREAYVDAAAPYDRAFQMSNRKNCAVGFRLAFNYLKASRYVDTIDVSKEILKVEPTYPKVQTDLIDKARSQIRS